MTDAERECAILEYITIDLDRLRMQADSIGRDLLAFMLDQAAVAARREAAKVSVVNGEQ